MKLCADCDHYESGTCIRPNPRINPVTGKFDPLYLSCYAERMSFFPFSVLSGACGRSADYFTPRDPAKHQNELLARC